MTDELTRLYDSYVDTYRGADGALPEMMELKREHTRFVVENAAAIADGEGFSPDERELALAAALLHDTGRYEQLRRYNTFRDSDSVDHAVFSHDIVKERGWLDPVERRGGGGGGGWREVVLKAVLYHNRREIPDGLDPLTELVSHTVRDADKLDIFRVLERQLALADGHEDKKAFWNLPFNGPLSAEVADSIERRRPVDYQNIKSLADFVMIQVGWMVSGLHFATTRRICRERGHLAYRRAFLHKIVDSPAVDRICDLVS